MTRLFLGSIQILTKQLHRADIKQQLRATDRHSAVLFLRLILAVALSHAFMEIDVCRLLILDRNLLDLAVKHHLLDRIPIGRHRLTTAIAHSPRCDDSNENHRPKPHNVRAESYHLIVVFPLI